MKTFPNDTEAAVRHLARIEVNVTPLLDVFCIDKSMGTVKDVTKLYRRLALLVHPDRVARYDRNGSNKGMRTLSRAFELFQNNVRYIVDVEECGTMDDAAIDRSMKFHRAVTEQEEKLYRHDFYVQQQREKLEEERRIEREAISEHFPPAPSSPFTPPPLHTEATCTTPPPPPTLPTAQTGNVNEKPPSRGPPSPSPSQSPPPPCSPAPSRDGDDNFSGDESSGEEWEKDKDDESSGEGCDLSDDHEIEDDFDISKYVNIYDDSN